MRNSVFHQSGGDDRDNGEERTQCVLCDGWFLSTNGLNSHMKVHKVTKCSDCEVEFETHGRYTFHRATEHGRRAKCLICGFIDPSPEKVVIHILQHEEMKAVNKKVLRHFTEVE